MRSGSHSRRGRRRGILTPMTDRPVNLNPSGPPGDPRPRAGGDRVGPRGRSSRPTSSAAPWPTWWRKPRCLQAPSWVTGPTTSSRTPTTASATTAGWTGSARLAGQRHAVGAPHQLGVPVPRRAASHGGANRRGRRGGALPALPGTARRTTSARSSSGADAPRSDPHRPNVEDQVFRPAAPEPGRTGEVTSPHHRRGRHRRSRRTRRSDRGR